MRGEVKYKAKLFVELHYGISKLNTEADSKRKIRERVESLTDRITYVYKVCVCLLLFFYGIMLNVAKDTTQRLGVYQHPILQQVINEVWFHNRSSDGVKHRTLYCKPASGISPHLIALVATAVFPFIHIET